MRKDIKKLLSVGLFCLSIGVWAQERPITGQVVDSDGFPVQDAYVYVDGSDKGVYTDADGYYSIDAETGDQISIEFIGFDTQTVAVGEQNTYDVQLSAGGTIGLKEVVATALGIEREKKALGYAAQEVSGDMLSDSKSNNALSALSGNVAGAQISTPSGNMGGSTRIVLRGIKSVTGENKPLIVVDGIPMSNDNYNTDDTQRGAGGRDYGDTAFDINPDDIETMNVLKGGAATALYGSRGANGVIMITTKSGKSERDRVEFNTGVTFESIAIFPDLQNQYGAGSSDTFQTATINGQTYNIVEYALDESWGPKYDANTYVLMWDAFDPEFADDYLNPRAWTAPENDAESFFNTGVTYNNSISFSKSLENSNLRVSFGNVYQTGILPNSNLRKNTLSVALDTKFSDRLKTSASLNYVNNKAFNRPVTGYDDNSVMQKMIQWGQRQLDYDRLKKYINADGSQRTWNRKAWNDATPNYSDNPYWTAYMNTSEDERDRYYGNFKLQYDLTDDLYVIGNVYGDGYNMTIEDHIAVGSQATSSYSISKRDKKEFNYEARLHYDKKLSDFDINSFIGVNRRNETYSLVSSETSGGLIVPLLYTLSNSMDQATTESYKSKKRVNSVYGMVSLGYKDMLFIEGTARNDWSSTLPEDDNSYFYPGVNASVVMSEVFNVDWINFWKIRGGWSRTGNDTDPYNLISTYVAGNNFINSPTYSTATTIKNDELKVETTESWEIGTEMSMLKNRVSFDVTYYDQVSDDLIMPVELSSTTGVYYKYFNAAKMSNKGWEVLVNLVPVKTENFDWTFSWNFSKNKNKVLDLYTDVDALNLASAPFNVSLYAVKGEEYGQIRGTDFIYDEDGNKVVNSSGRYATTATDQNLGSVLPDYNFGLRNTFNYKNVSLTVLIDRQKGGKYFSTSNMWGMYSGMLEATAANGIRENGIVLEGVTGDISYNSDGSYTVTNTATNTQVTSASNYGYNFYIGPERQNVFDADYWKLREVVLTYSLPSEFTGPFAGVDISFFGRNLLTWGLDNDDFDPEMATSGSGNVQGLEGGNMPSTRTYGMNLKLQF